MIKSLKFGVDLINDVSGFEYDKNSLKNLKKNQYRKSNSSYARNS